jgi:two-component system, OmpR family, sensor histidine kinase CiaH
MNAPFKKIRLATLVYWVLLLYIIAALVWWFISLERQNRRMTEMKMDRLKSTVDSTANARIFAYQLKEISLKEKRDSTKHLAEGLTFLVLILIGAAFVYQSVRRQLKLQQQQQNFMMAVTHELKTPISVARLNLETLQKHNLDPEKQQKIIKMTLQETGRLNTLTNNILIASQLEAAGGAAFSKEELDLGDLLKDCMREYRNRFPERNFTERIENDIAIKGDALLLQMLINNLLENAVKYSAKEKPVYGRLRMQNKNAVLSIIDEGLGIADTEKKKIFDKFYRTGNEATRKTQGTGLGLYLCKKIAKDHNADIQVTNNEPAGSIFTVIFHT